ncbi:hypothetical protein A1O7_09830 [Cladophialophora yegresii CBS 114405]|uniref:Tetratricopeptide SHNi-TPR domain-containing protein n=1 Tax=Cladophialophora yegresii CBS 114405 TaxID=1182544 RepID=W9VNC0_9EURO|nr:uncharacterized protein A1O7_09830 [Cladophialophora yegresii CBS 114405]EXJ54490.1 hypothetical protein A1O7_09830 [Cladophialophora yegresii CBS 114405]
MATNGDEVSTTVPDPKHEEQRGMAPSMAAATDQTSGNPPDADKHAQLTELIAQAAAEYAVKHYSEAAELYSQATELQAELNGEMAIENADLYYSYGKCLFFLAQQSSSVLGGTAASAQLSSSKAQKSGKKRKANGATKAEASTTNGGGAGATSKAVSAASETTVPNVGDVVPQEDVKQPPQTASDKPYFQISGDAEGWDDSEDDEADEDEEAGEEDDDDDFATSYEFLDLARVLYLKKLDQSQEHAMEDSEKGKYVASIDLTPEVKALKARVAEIYDLQAEVELEGEKYSDAATNLNACLALREELERPESSILAECHYKLSLALEFSASSEERDAAGHPTGKLSVDWKIRNEAIAQQEKAIDVCKMRVAAETAALDKLDAGPAKDKAMAQIEDVQDMIAEMEVRLEELRKPPVSVKAESENQMKQQIQGVLGSLLGSGVTEEEKKEKLAQVTEKATDISGMVKRKKPKPTESNGGDSGQGSAASTPAAAASAVASGSSLGKRKVEFMDDAAHAETGKKAKVEDVEDSGV